MVQHQNPTAEEIASREDFRARLGKGCLIALIPLGALGIVAIAALVWLFTGTDWGEPSRGLANTGDLKPLPEGAEVVVEGGSCPGNGDGWHLCSWTVRIRIPGFDADEAARLTAEHYRDKGRDLVVIDTPPGADWSTIYDEPQCMEGDDREHLLCLSIEKPHTHLDPGEGVLNEPLEGDEVDLVATTWTYFL